MGFAEALRALMAERGISVRELARRVPCDKGHVSRLRNGHTRPSPTTAAKLDEILGAGGKLAALGRQHATTRRDALKLGVMTSVTPEVLSRVLDGAADEAMEFTRMAGVTAVGRGVFEHLDAVIASIDRAYCTQPPAALLPLARAYRARVADLIAGPCTLRESRGLYVRAAWLSDNLAWLAHDLGHSLAAEAYAIDAFEHADQAGHGEQCAWAADTMASVALYTGRAHHAVAAARKGISKAPAGHPLAVRLRAQAARAYAKLGQRCECEQMLAEAEALHARLPPRPPSRFGADTGVLASYAMTAYPASCFVWMGDYRQAEMYARRAVAVHEAAPDGSRAPSREAIARIDLAIAVSALGAPDEGSVLGRAALGSPRVVDSVLSRARDLDAMLMARYPGREDARSFREQYRSLIAARRAIGG